LRVIGSKVAAAALAGVMLFDSTAAVAAATPPAAPPQASGASWLTLSMLTPTGAIGLAGTAAQPAADQPPPSPPPGPPPHEGNAVAGVPLPVIGIWLAEVALAVYILTKNHRSRFIFPVSPA
jgi:hypothetical protein